MRQWEKRKSRRERKKRRSKGIKKERTAEDVEGNREQTEILEMGLESIWWFCILLDRKEGVGGRRGE